MLKFIASALLNQAAEGSCLGAQLSPCPHGMHFLFGIKCCFNPSPLVDTGSQSHDGPWGKKNAGFGFTEVNFIWTFLFISKDVNNSAKVNSSGNE